MEKTLQKHIIGQAEAVEAISRAIQLAKALAVEYFGSENGGQLIEAVRHRPHSLILFDEIEKAHCDMKEIVEIMLKQVYERLKEKNIKVEVTKRLKEEIVKEGYNPGYGARPLRRAIGRLLEDNLAERILNGRIKQGDSVTINVDSNGKILVQY
ncbi:hypothetical protein Patl1_02562 [Pistacia atlantica]|uniref:Uncharacterized protein n=1 Tax=Pistacia atlantica TaxID=434234 RepID=A0ACC1C7G8_9ROSI|nr:hypothetical protein Patl1_02562 [Pistacia atlantica]